MVGKQLLNFLQAHGSTFHIDEVTKLFGEFKIGQFVRTHFVLKIKEMQRNQEASMSCLKDLERKKQQENAELAKTIRVVKKMYMGKPDEGRYQRIIECLE